MISKQSELTQRQIAQQIIDAGGDYVMVVKENQLRLLFERIQQRHYWDEVAGIHVDQSAQVLRCLKLATRYLDTVCNSAIARHER